MSQLTSSSGFGMMATDWIDLKVIVLGGEFLLFRQKLNSGLKRLKNLSSEKFGFPPNFLRFLYDGRYCLDSQTPMELEMEQGDVIDAFMPQMSTNLIIKVAGNSIPGPLPFYSEQDLYGNMRVHKEVLAYK